MSRGHVVVALALAAVLGHGLAELSLPPAERDATRERPVTGPVAVGPRGPDRSEAVAAPPRAGEVGATSRRDDDPVAAARALTRALEGLSHDDARARLRDALESCRDPRARDVLIATERRLRLRRSPLALADAVPPRTDEIAEALGPAALPEHARLLEDVARPRAVRAAAARALGAAGDPRAADLLARALIAADVVTRALAVEALGGRATLAQAEELAVTRALDDPAPEVRSAAARGLGVHGRGGDALARAATRELDPLVLADCLEALGAKASPEHLALLQAHARSGPSAVRDAARRALARAGLELVDGRDLR